MNFVKKNCRVRVNQRICFPPNINDFPLSAPPPCLLAVRERRKAESGTAREVYMLIYPDPLLRKLNYFGTT